MTARSYTRNYTNLTDAIKAMYSKGTFENCSPETTIWPR